MKVKKLAGKENFENNKKWINSFLWFSGIAFQARAKVCSKTKNPKDFSQKSLFVVVSLWSKRLNGIKCILGKNCNFSTILFLFFISDISQKTCLFQRSFGFTTKWFGIAKHLMWALSSLVLSFHHSLLSLKSDRVIEPHITHSQNLSRLDSINMQISFGSRCKVSIQSSVENNNCLSECLAKHDVYY